VGYIDVWLWAPSVAFVTLFFSFWCYFITKKLINKNIHGLSFNFTKFSRALIFAAIYMILLSAYFEFSDTKKDDPGWILVLILLGQFIFLYWLLFLLNFMAKLISAVELQKSVTFDKYANYFFGLFFFPLGIWWLGPKIKSLLSQR
jgi:hypothetical protein